MSAGGTFLIYRVAISLLKGKAKQIQRGDILQQLGLKNFRLKELNDLDDKGFVRLVQLVQVLRQPAIGSLGGMEQFIPKELRAFFQQPSVQQVTASNT